MADLRILEDDKESCGTCRFWLIAESPARGAGLPAIGECRRYPPSKAGSVDQQWYPLKFPNTFENMWCGEFSALINEDEDEDEDWVAGDDVDGELGRMGTISGEL